MREETPRVAAQVEDWRCRLVQHNAQHEKAELQALDQWLGPKDPGLTEAQKWAIVRDDKANLVVAAAGSGKTDVLVHRIAHLVRRGVAPERILAVTYTVPAAEEMALRLDRSFGIRGVDVRTFHSLGRAIVLEARGEPPTVIGERATRDFLHSALRQRLETGGPFLDDLLAFLAQPDRQVQPQKTDFATKEAFYQAMRGQRYRTLRGEDVKSLAEKQIADFLTIHGVPYRYEAIRAPGSNGKRAHRPDFTLPGGIYIEHWTIRPGQQVPRWYDETTDEYRERIRWVRMQFPGRSLVETYHDEFIEGRLNQVLRERLRAAGVALRPIPYRELVKRIHEHWKFDRNVVQVFERWIANAKALGLRPEEIPARLRGKPPRTQAFGRCAMELLNAYQGHLREKGWIDFSDMIHEAIAHLRGDPGKSAARYDHILVDEFQDASKDKVDLLHALLEGDAHLFCVGDDWQSIYSFSGADVRFFRDFEAWFGSATVTILEDCWRCPSGIVEAGNRLMAYNRGQIAKRVVSRSGHTEGPIVRELEDGPAYRQDVVQHARQWVRAKLDGGAHPNQLMVLCRYNDPLDALMAALHADGIPLQGSRGSGPARDNGVRLRTVHRAKGTQAAHVLLMDAAEPGFPSDKEDPTALEPVRLGTMERLEEERRLFYVALTRAKQTLDIQTCSSRPSRFLHEIEPAGPAQGPLAVLRRAPSNLAGAHNPESMRRGAFRAKTSDSQR